MPRVPRGYRQEEFPLWHKFDYMFFLRMELETKNSHIATILRTSEVITTPEVIEVNPSNANFAEDTGCLIHNGSIVPKINFNMSAQLTKPAIETDKIRAIRFNWMPIYVSFLQSLEAQDDRTDVQIEDILELQHDTTNKDTYPLYTGTDLGSGNFQGVTSVAMTEVFGDIGLSVDLNHESVAFDPDLYFDAKKYYSNKSMLRKVAPKWNSAIITRDRPFLYHSNNFTYPSVKRGHPYTFCGILTHVEMAGEANQLMSATDVTDIEHLRVNMTISYPEWNQNFDQSSY